MNISYKVIIIFFVTYFNNILVSQGTSEIKYIHITSDTLYNSNQNINIVILNKTILKRYQIDLAYRDSLTQTSTMAEDAQALAAINGGFFNMKDGFSVSYLEHHDEIIAHTQNENDKRSSSAPMLNASFIIEKEGDIIIEEEKKDSIYFSSNAEYGVLGAGPLLLLNSEKSTIRPTSFSSNRHPRTCICETKEDIMLITVDGRNPRAEGMSLFELQNFLLTLNCIDAINMDGGGSTTMWIKDKGVVNMPSDITGERPAANAILIRKIIE